MKYMKYNESEVISEFGRIMKGKEDLQKTAQVLPPAPYAPGTTVPEPAPVPAGEMPQMWKDLNAKLEASRGNAKMLEAVQNKLQTLNYPTTEQGYYDQALQKLQRYMAPDQLAADFKAKQTAMLHKSVPSMSKHQSSTNVKNIKNAEEKKYDVMPKEDIVQDAHPGKAMVSGDVVENLNQQQEADLEVAQKSAREVLAELYKLAQKLKAEKNEEAYKLVKATFMEIAAEIKKGA